MAEYTGLVAVIHGSASSDGVPIGIQSIVSPGDTLHEALGGPDQVDTVVIYPFNRHSATVTLTIEVTYASGASPASDQLEIQVRAHERAAPVVLRVENTVKVRAFCPVADVVSCLVAVDRYTR